MSSVDFKTPKNREHQRWRDWGDWGGWHEARYYGMRTCGTPQDDLCHVATASDSLESLPQPSGVG